MCSVSPTHLNRFFAFLGRVVFRVSRSCPFVPLRYCGTCIAFALAVTTISRERRPLLRIAFIPLVSLQISISIRSKCPR